MKLLITGQGWAQYCDLSVPSRQINCWSWMMEQINDLQDAGKSLWFVITGSIPVPRALPHFDKHQELRPLGKYNTWNPRFTGSDSQTFHFSAHAHSRFDWRRIQNDYSKNCTFPDVMILSADQKKQSIWEREWAEAVICRCGAISANEKEENTQTQSIHTRQNQICC